jgi:hypothetical protein
LPASMIRDDTPESRSRKMLDFVEYYRMPSQN